MKTLTTLLIALALTGCATCERHPVACTVGTAIVIGSVVASTQHGGPVQHPMCGAAYCMKGPTR